MVLRSGEKDMQHTILIVDDEAWHRRGMTNLLKSLYPEMELLEAKMAVRPWSCAKAGKSIL